jgi:hypothetical protein
LPIFLKCAKKWNVSTMSILESLYGYFPQQS